MNLTEPDKKAITSFGRRFRILRFDLHLTQAQLARLLWEGCGGQDSVSRLERGIARGISTGMLMRLASLCESKGFSLSWLLLGRGPKGLGSTDLRGLVTEVLASLHASLHQMGEATKGS
ncbi:MAG TPA: helix-turn-helix domain-containing protein [Phycisphaerae bacterium]|nr:helix-turn-helix domain-containing protein [Phycisphaerae bacterium]